MYDFAVPNQYPGTCAKCGGTGEYRWGPPTRTGEPSKSGPCHSCGGTGHQTRRDMARNQAYNRRKLATLATL